MNKLSFTMQLAPEDVLDVTLWTMHGKLMKFSLNYRAFIQAEWREVYRVDNFHHGGIHEHRFWRGREALPVQEQDAGAALVQYKDIIVRHYERFRTYAEERTGRAGR